MRAAALALVAMVLAACAPFDSTSEEGRPSRFYADPNGWTMRYPQQWRLERSEAHLRLEVWAVTVASFEPHRTVKRTSAGFHVRPPLDPAGQFPADGVAFRVLRYVGGPWPGPEAPGAAADLLLREFRPFLPRADASGVRPVERSFVLRGSRYELLAWVGPDAPLDHRNALADVVSSLAFPE